MAIGCRSQFRLQNGTVQMLDLDANAARGHDRRISESFRRVGGETSTQNAPRIAKPLTDSMQE
jgi:hypothetical protein